MARKGKVVRITVLLSVIFTAAAFAEDPYIVGVTFDGFCRQHFSAVREPEVYAACGDDLEIAGGSIWEHVSETSAVVGWKSSLPAKSYIQYGDRAGVHIWVTPITDRNHFLHLHRLRNLRPNTTYHYQLVTLDEKIRIVRSEERSFTTHAAPNTVRIPEYLQGPPYVLDKPNTTYLLGKDVRADSTAFNIVADGITLDLGGHKVTYNEKEGAPDPGASERLFGSSSTQGPCGVRTADGKKGIRIVNGTIEQGAARSASRPSGYYPVYLRRPRGAEVAGLNVVYSGSQVSGIIVNNGDENVKVHHNVIFDKGTELYNRHRGVEAILFNIEKPKKTARCHQNLIKRTRHCGIVASAKTEIFANEIYIDSYATNSYGIKYYSQRGASDISIHHNRIFGTGFHPIGIGSGQLWSEVKVYGNYIQMQGTKQEWRWAGGEGGGDKDAANRTGIYPVNGIRMQKPRENVLYYENVVVVKGSGTGCFMRGLWLVPDSKAGKNVVFRDNRIKAIAQDSLAHGFAIAASGVGMQAASPVVTLINNRIESNVVNVQLADNYGAGGPYLFNGNTFVKSGHDGRYKTVRVGWQGYKRETYGHRFEDNRFEGGASFDTASFDGLPGIRCEFSVAWNLDIRTSPAARVSIKNSGGRRIYTGTADGNGKLVVSLTQYVYGAERRRTLTPHTVTAEKGGRESSRTINLDRSQTIVIEL